MIELNHQSDAEAFWDWGVGTASAGDKCRKSRRSCTSTMLMLESLAMTAIDLEMTESKGGNYLTVTSTGETSCGRSRQTVKVNKYRRVRECVTRER